MRRPSGARGGGRVVSRAGAADRAFAEGASICRTICFEGSPSSAISESRNGATDFVIAVHNTRSSAESTRRRLPSLELIELVTPFGGLSWHASSRARSGRRSNNHFRAWRRQGNTRPRCNHIAASGNTLRHEHHELPVLLDAPRDMTGLFAMPEIDIRASWSDNRRPGVLRHQQMTECCFWPFALDRKFGIDPDRRSINVDLLVDRQ